MNYNPFSLQEKTILITGASSGIGQAVAIECSKMGAKIVITGRNEERLNETYNRLEGEGHLKIVADLTKENDVNSLIDFLPLLDGIVHSAGIAMPLPFSFTTKEKIDTIFSINFASPAIISQQILKNRKLKIEASIVFISSISGVICTSTGGSLYSATKGAVNGLVKGMAVDLASKKIRVNCVNPGMIDTAIFESGVISQEQLEEDIKKYPLKRYG